MKKRIVAILIFTIMAFAAFAEGFDTTVERTISQIIPSSDTLVVVRAPVYADDNSAETVFGKYLKEILESGLTGMGKSLFDIEANERSEEFLASLSDSGYSIDLSAFNLRRVPDGEISCVYVEHDNMVQLSFVYKQYIGVSKRTSLTFSTKELPGLTYTIEDAETLSNRLRSSVRDGNAPEDARSLCLVINSLEDKKNNVIREYNSLIASKQNAINSWYRTEYNRRIGNAKKEPWESDEDFKEAMQEELVVLNLERSKLESDMMCEAALEAENYSTMDIQQELDVYYSILAEKQFVVRTNNCRVMDYDSDSQCFPVQISVSYPTDNPQITYSKKVICYLSKPGEILTRSERSKRYNIFVNGTPSAEITYRVVPSGNEDGMFVNEVRLIRLFNASDNTLIYEEAVRELTSVFLPSAVNSTVSAKISVIAVPSKAVIKVDYVQKGNAPLVIKDLEKGEHVIEAVWEDGSTAQKTIKVIPGLVETVELRKR